MPHESPSEARPPVASDLRIGMVQVRPSKGDVARNLEAVRTAVHAAGSGLDLLVFPEAATTGYFLEGGVQEGARTVDDLVLALGDAPADAPDVVIGFYEGSRGRVFNSAVHLTPGKGGFEPVHVHRKVFLPTYGLFEEARFVDPGRDVRAYDTRFGRMGMLICEDAWHSLTSSILALDGAELIVIPSASPARDFRPAGGVPGNLTQWDRLAGGAAREHGVFVAVVQLVGSEGGKVFPGGSVLADPEGEIATRGPLLEEAVVVAGLQPRSLERARGSTPLLADLRERLPVLQRSLERVSGDPDGCDDDVPSAAPAAGGLRGRSGVEGGARHERGEPEGEAGIRSDLELDYALVERTLVEFIRDEVRGRGFERVVIGVSGGVDSAVALVLACRALGADNVHGFRLPYATSSKASLDHAALVLDQVGAHSHTIEITGPVDAYADQRPEELSPLRLGNLAARTRAVVLFDQSARLHALPLGTGNKSERLLGYFTWHADDSPPINPLGDLLKTQVWALARHLGVPGEIVDKPASADLVKGVDDEDELGISYHRADPILHGLLEGLGSEELVAMGFADAEVRLVCSRLDSTHWKRELPAVAMLSSSAIGESYLRPVDYLGRKGIHPGRGHEAPSPRQGGG